MAKNSSGQAKAGLNGPKFDLILSLNLASSRPLTLTLPLSSKEPPPQTQQKLSATGPVPGRHGTEKSKSGNWVVLGARLRQGRGALLFWTLRARFLVPSFRNPMKLWGELVVDRRLWQRRVHFYLDPACSGPGLLLGGVTPLAPTLFSTVFQILRNHALISQCSWHFLSAAMPSLPLLPFPGRRAPQPRPLPILPATPLRTTPAVNRSAGSVLLMRHEPCYMISLQCVQSECTLFLSYPTQK